MGDIIDTKDHYIYLLLLIMILVLIIKTDTDVILIKYEARRDVAGTFADWFRESVDTYWPTLVGILGIIVFMAGNKGSRAGGYPSLFVIMFLAVFFTSYTIFQWEVGSERRAGARTTTPGGGCTALSSGGRSALQSETGTISSESACEAPDAYGICSDPSFTGTPGGDNKADCRSSGTCTTTDVGDAALGADGQAFRQAGVASATAVVADQSACDAVATAARAAHARPDGTPAVGITTAFVASSPPATWQDLPGSWSERAAGQMADVPSDGNCSIILPKSNHFQTKEYQFYRFIYYLTLIIVSSCAAHNINIEGYFANIIILSPFIIPLFIELISEMLNFVKDENTVVTKLSPEVLLIHFMRGSHTGDPTSLVGTPAAYPSFTDGGWLEDDGGKAFFNAHFMFTMVLYIILLLLMVVHSQGYYGYQQSNIPIYIGITVLVGFPFILRYIFIQDCSINAASANLPDGVNDTSANAAPGAKTLYTRASTGDYTTVAGSARIEEKEDADCRIEKYGGIQMMLCASLIIMVLTKTQQRKDKALAFGIMILLTYGLSQTFIYTNIYEVDAP